MKSGNSRKKRKIDLIRLLCSCGKRVKVSASFAGKIGRCPQCGKRMPIPSLDVIEAKMKEMKKKGQNEEDLDFDLPSMPSLKEIVLDNSKSQDKQADTGTSAEEEKEDSKPPWLAKKGKLPAASKPAPVKGKSQPAEAEDTEESAEQPEPEEDAEKTPLPDDPDQDFAPAAQQSTDAQEYPSSDQEIAATEEMAPPARDRMHHATATAAMLHASPYQAEEAEAAVAEQEDDADNIYQNLSDPGEAEEQIEEATAHEAGEEVAAQEASEQIEEAAHAEEVVEIAEEFAFAGEVTEDSALAAQEALPADSASEIMAKPLEEIAEVIEEISEQDAELLATPANDLAPHAQSDIGQEDMEICEVFEEAVAVEESRPQDSALVAVEETPSDDVVEALVISEGESDVAENEVPQAQTSEDKENKENEERMSDSSILLEVMEQQPIEGGENLLKGKQKLESESCDEALQYLCACIAQEEDLAAAYYLRAVVYIKKKAWDLSLEDLEKAKICGHNEEDVENRINQVRYLRANHYRSIGAYSEALADLDQIISSNVSAEKGKVYWARARYLIRQKAWEAALEDIEKAIQVHYLKPTVYEAGGKISLTQGDFESAVHYFTAAINKGGKNVYLYHARSEANFFLKNFDAALADVKTAQQMTPEDPYLYDLEGLILNEKSLHKDADKAFEHSLGLSPEDPTHYFNRGIAYIGRGRYDLAISDFSKVIQLDNKDRLAYLKRAICYQEKKNPNLAQAREDFKKVAELEKNSFYRGHH